MKQVYRYIWIAIEHPEIAIDAEFWSWGDHRRARRTKWCVTFRESAACLAVSRSPVVVTASPNAGLNPSVPTPLDSEEAPDYFPAPKRAT